jgi:signal transduction histidine kinase
VTTQQNASSSEQQAAQAISSWLQNSGLAPAAVQDHLVTSAAGSFYVTCAAADAGTAYFVFYVDVTGIVSLAGDVNRLLIVIMLGAVAVTVLASVVITRRLTRPLVDLTAFSRRIGTGDFTTMNEQFNDREFTALADSMNQAARQLEAYDKDQKTFFQNVSHEFRTPLTSITCYAEGIAYGIMDPPAASRTILTESARLSDMVEDLLSLSRLDTTGRTTATVLCNVATLLTAAAADQQTMATEAGLTFVFDVDETPVLLQGNDVALQRAFSNLISNAIRYAAHRITLGCRRVGDDVVVTVADDGPGVDATDLPHIFERFYKGKGGSHGIGLAIVKSVAEAHGGRVGVTTGPDGATFRLSLPVTPPGPTGDANPAPTRS